MYFLHYGYTSKLNYNRLETLWAEKLLLSTNYYYIALLWKKNFQGLHIYRTKKYVVIFDII